MSRMGTEGFVVASNSTMWLHTMSIRTPRGTQLRCMLLISVFMVCNLPAAFSQSTTNRPTKAKHENEFRGAVIPYLADGCTQPDRLSFISFVGKNPSRQFLHHLTTL